MLDPPPGLHRDDALHEGETAKQWLADCDARMARKAATHSLGTYRAARRERRTDRATFQPGYTPVTVVEDLASLDPDFDRHTDQYDRIMSWFSGDICCPGFSYLGRGHCPQHGGI